MLVPSCWILLIISMELCSTDLHHTPGDTQSRRDECQSLLVRFPWRRHAFLHSFLLPGVHSWDIAVTEEPQSCKAASVKEDSDICLRWLSSPNLWQDSYSIISREMGKGKERVVWIWRGMWGAGDTKKTPLSGFPIQWM